MASATPDALVRLDHLAVARAIAPHAFREADGAPDAHPLYATGRAHALALADDLHRLAATTAGDVGRAEIARILDPEAFHPRPGRRYFAERRGDARAAAGDILRLARRAGGTA